MNHEINRLLNYGLQNGMIYGNNKIDIKKIPPKN